MLSDKDERPLDGRHRRRVPGNATANAAARETEAEGRRQQGKAGSQAEAEGHWGAKKRP